MKRYSFLMSVQLLCNGAEMVSLDDKLRDAGVSTGFYSTVKDPINQADWQKLHEQGNLIDADFLKRIFLKSIFPYYSRGELGVFSPYTGLKNERTLAIGEGVMKIFQQNPHLIKLGIAFERKKIILEKMQELLRKLMLSDSEKAEILLKNLYAQEGLLEDIQTMLYNFMKSGYEEFITKIKDVDIKGLSAQKQMDARIAAGNFLADYIPDFIQEHTKYKKIWDSIDGYLKPFDPATLL